MAKLDVPESPSWIQVISALKGKEQRKIGHNTYARRFGDAVHIRYHSTIIAIVEPGKVMVHSGGYYTTTTKQRLNHFLPRRYGITQHKYEWFVFDRDNDFKRTEYFDGMTFELAD